MARVRCEPLYDGDPGGRNRDGSFQGHCGKVYDDSTSWSLCPHTPLDQPFPKVGSNGESV